MESRSLLEMNRLIELLRKVDESPALYRIEENNETDRKQYDVSHHVINDIVYYANEYLITGPDVHIWRNMVKEAGYPVFPGEVDRFGWLTAYFQMREGIILFG